MRNADVCLLIKNNQERVNSQHCEVFVLLVGQTQEVNQDLEPVVRNEHLHINLQSYLEAFARTLIVLTDEVGHFNLYFSRTIQISELYQIWNKTTETNSFLMLCRVLTDLVNEL